MSYEFFRLSSLKKLDVHPGELFRHGRKVYRVVGVFRWLGFIAATEYNVVPFREVRQNRERKHG